MQNFYSLRRKSIFSLSSVVTFSRGYIKVSSIVDTTLGLFENNLSTGYIPCPYLIVRNFNLNRIDRSKY